MPCKLTNEIKNELSDKLAEIKGRVCAAENLINQEQGCILCEITAIRNLAQELEGIASFYHFQSSLLPFVGGLEEIARALAALSAKRHGALLAVEKGDSLEPYIQSCKITGTPIGAKVSAPLLESIFYPGNPLHDGAVIIREGEIVSAGCVLPLSERKYTGEGKKIGTRHRAAMGLSERTDALVIVVSEETGQVSFAIEGVLHPMQVRLCPPEGTPEGLTIPDRVVYNYP